MRTKETNGGHSEESGEAGPRDDSRVQQKSNANGKSAGANSEPGAHLFDDTDIDFMLRQQERLAAAIASSRRREEINNRIRELETQRDNADESEEPRGDTIRERPRFRSQSIGGHRRTRASTVDRDSEFESNGDGVQSAKSLNTQRPASGRKRSRSSANERDQSGTSTNSSARLIELQLEMEAEKARLALQQHQQRHAAAGHHEQRRPHEHHRRDSHRGARGGSKSDYQYESDGDEHGERRGRPRARQDRGRTETRGRKRAYSSSDDSDLDSRAFESDVSQDREGESSSSDEGEPPSSARTLNARDMLSHWRREAKVLDPVTQRECRRILRLLKVFKHENPVHKPRHVPMLSAFRAELVTLVVTRTHGPAVAAGYNIQRKSQLSAGGVDQRALDKAIKRHKSYEAVKNEPVQTGRLGPGRPRPRGGRQKGKPRARLQRPEPSPGGGRGPGTKPPGKPTADFTCHKCKKTGHRAADCPAK